MSPSVIEKPKKIIHPDVLSSLSNMVSEEGQVIIHGIFSTHAETTSIRIWQSTYLFDKHTAHVSELVHFEKISAFPVWTMIPPFSKYIFTLFFSVLPKSCILFDLKEVIPQSNGFYVPDIKRNNTDIYFLDFT